MTKLAVFGDIHSNLPALEAVLADADANGVSRENIIIPGDILGYGDQPMDCLDAVRFLTGNLIEVPSYVKGIIPARFQGHGKKASVTDGNHERATVRKMRDPRTNLGGLRISPRADESITRGIEIFKKYLSGGEKGLLSRLSSALGSGEETEADERRRSVEGVLDFIQNLPVEHVRRFRGITAYFTHSNPLDPEDYSLYVMDKALAKEYGKGTYVDPAQIFASRRMRDFNVICVCHSHIPGIWAGNASGEYMTVEKKLTEEGIKDLGMKVTKILFNPGSVGNPRTGTNEAQYGIIDDDGPVFVQIREVPYDKK